MNKFLIALAVLFTVSGSPASAATVVWDWDPTSSNSTSDPDYLYPIGRLFGARNVNVNGTLYDVQFMDGNCISLFTLGPMAGGCNEDADFAFQTLALALAVRFGVGAARLDTA